jgi:hypothetical protein
MSKKVFITTKSFYHERQYLGGEVVEFNQHVTDELLKRGLIQLRWRPEVIPLVEPKAKPEPEPKPKKKRKPRQTHKNMKTK